MVYETFDNEHQRPPLKALAKPFYILKLFDNSILKCMTTLCIQYLSATRHDVTAALKVRFHLVPRVNPLWTDLEYVVIGL